MFICVYLCTLTLIFDWFQGFQQLGNCWRVENELSLTSSDDGVSGAASICMFTHTHTRCTYSLHDGNWGKVILTEDSTSWCAVLVHWRKLQKVKKVIYKIFLIYDLLMDEVGWSLPCGFILTQGWIDSFWSCSGSGSVFKPGQNSKTTGQIFTKHCVAPRNTWVQFWINPNLTGTLNLDQESWDIFYVTWIWRMLNFLDRSGSRSHPDPGYGSVLNGQIFVKFGCALLRLVI